LEETELDDGVNEEDCDEDDAEVVATEWLGPWLFDTPLKNNNEING
jgi:hypothetical protein